MQQNVSVYDILISCPGDVSEYIGGLEEAINSFNNFYGRESNILLRSISWKNNVYSELGNHPQKIINKQIVDKADICVAVFWKRFGTSTEHYGSGTEEEIERMLTAGKQVFLYFLDKQVSPSEIDMEQYKKIIDFKDKYKNKGLYFVCQDEKALSNLFREHLELYIHSIIEGSDFVKDQGKKMILWVDDCPENNVYERNLLDNYGIKFELALSTERALNLIRSNHYSLIISDMGRKEGNREGYALLKAIREKGLNVPFIIYATEGGKSSHRKQAEEMGAQGSTSSATELVNMVLKELINNR